MPIQSATPKRQQNLQRELEQLKEELEKQKGWLHNANRSKKEFQRKFKLEKCKNAALEEVIKEKDRALDENIAEKARIDSKLLQEQAKREAQIEKARVESELLEEKTKANQELETLQKKNEEQEQAKEDLLQEVNKLQKENQAQQQANQDLILEKEKLKEKVQAKRGLILRQHKRLEEQAKESLEVVKAKDARISELEAHNEQMKSSADSYARKLQQESAWSGMEFEKVKENYLQLKELRNLVVQLYCYCYRRETDDFKKDAMMEKQS